MYLYIPGIREAVENAFKSIEAYLVGDAVEKITLQMAELNAIERDIILKGCLINYYAK